MMIITHKTIHDILLASQQQPALRLKDTLDWIPRFFSGSLYKQYAFMQSQMHLMIANSSPLVQLLGFLEWPTWSIHRLGVEYPDHLRRLFGIWKSNDHSQNQTRAWKSLGFVDMPNACWHLSMQDGCSIDFWCYFPDFPCKIMYKQTQRTRGQIITTRKCSLGGEITSNAHSETCMDGTGARIKGFLPTLLRPELQACHLVLVHGHVDNRFHKMLRTRIGAARCMNHV